MAAQECVIQNLCFFQSRGEITNNNNELSLTAAVEMKEKKMTSSQQLLYLSRADVENVALDISAIVDLLEKAFRLKGEDRVEMPPKPGTHTQPDAFIHAMLAYIPGLRSAGVKWVSGYPENYRHGLPYITGCSF